MRKILILDVCYTLTPLNTTMDFIEHSIVENKHRKLLMNVRSKFIMKLISYVIFKAFDFDFIRWLYIRRLKKYSVSDVAMLADCYVSKITYNKKVLNIVNKYIRSGFEVYLVSASLEPIVKSMCHYLNFSGYYATELSQTSSGYSGIISRDLLDKKWDIVKSLSEKADYSVMISDNFGDLDCSRFVDEFKPVVLNDKGYRYWLSAGFSNCILLY